MPADSKVYEYNKPFARYKYPLFGEKGPNGEVELSGRGYDCGCNTEDDYPFAGVGVVAAIFTEMRRVMNAVPGWVPALGVPELERESQGTLTRSFQTWTDVPLWQWHRYYDWNFHIVPDEGYEFYRGAANTTPGNIPTARVVHIVNGRRERLTVGMTAVVKGRNMECEWDVGAFGKRPGGMFRHHWHWPMAGDQFWAVGRSIYDCGHPDSANTNVGIMRSELHPLKAIATARWEAEAFPENGGKFVPAIKFMFFASEAGGYVNVPTLNAADYEFIVDLPQLATGDEVFPIGHTPRYGGNTIVLRPRLLAKFDSSPFEKTMAETPMDVEEPLPTLGKVTPEIRLAPDYDPATPQAIVKIPLTKISGGNAYGMVVSLGWFDPDGTTAKLVKKVTVNFEKITSGSLVHTADDLSRRNVLREEWFLKMGVNGRWFWFYSAENAIGVGEVITLKNMEHTFWLAEGDFIKIAAHGAERNNVDDVMWWPREDRVLTLDGNQLDYIIDIQNGGAPGPPTRQNRDARLGHQQDIFREFAWTMRGNRNQSAPLGLLDKTIAVRTLPEKQLQRFNDTVSFTTEVGTSAELAESTVLTDYTLTYTVLVEPQ